MFSSRQRRETEALLWTVAEFPYAIDVSWAMLEEINGFAQEGLRKLSRGGVEVGGLLFGRRTEQVIRILAWRPIHCEHARGPGFILSNNDKQALVQQIEAAEQDPRLQVLEPVGWFVSHTRAGVAMTDEDAELFSRVLPEPWQTTLVLHPYKVAPTRAGFFLRALNDTIRRESSYREFTIEGMRAAAPVTTGPPAPPKVERREVAVPERPSVEPAPMVSPRILWMLAVLMACAFAVFAIPKFRSAGADSGPPPPLNLRLADTRGHLRIEWDRQSVAIQNADGARLHINDGNSLPAIDLDRETIQKGAITYARMTEDVTVRLVVRRAGHDFVQDMVRYVGAPIPKVESRELRKTRENRDRLVSESSRLRERLDAESARTDKLEKELKRIRGDIARMKK